MEIHKKYVNMFFQVSLISTMGRIRRNPKAADLKEIRKEIDKRKHLAILHLGMKLMNR